jgi:hypothetical protein
VFFCFAPDIFLSKTAGLQLGQKPARVADKDMEQDLIKCLKVNFWFDLGLVGPADALLSGSLFGSYWSFLGTVWLCLIFFGYLVWCEGSY